MKERREQPNQKTNPPMITSCKEYTKKNIRTDRTLGQMVKAKLYSQNHTQKHTPTHSKREKGKIYIYFCSQCPPPQFGMIRCLFMYSTDAGLSSWLWRFNLFFLKLLGDISLSRLSLHSSFGSALDLALPLPVGRLRASVPIPDRTGLK